MGGPSLVSGDRSAITVGSELNLARTSIREVHPCDRNPWCSRYAARAPPLSMSDVLKCKMSMPFTT